MTNTQINRLNVIEIKVIKGQKCASPRIYREVVKNKKKAQKLTVSAALSSCFIITIIINVTKSLVEVSPLHSLHLLFPSPLLPCWKKHHQKKKKKTKNNPETSLTDASTIGSQMTIYRDTRLEQPFGFCWFVYF